MLVAARAVQGTGAALMNPLSLSILVATFPRKRLSAAIGVWAGISGLGLAIGPLLGGLLVEHVDWSAVFWINVPIGVIAMAVTLLSVQESRDLTGRSLDLGGATLVTAALFCIVWGLIKSEMHGFGSAYVIGFLAVGTALLALFVLWERRARDPMLPLEFFARRQFTVSDAVTLLIGFAMFGAIFYGALFLQNIQGYTALQAGVRTLPWTLMILAVAPAAGRLNAKIGARLPASAGMLLVAVGLSGLARVDATAGYSSIWPWFVLCGIGTALAMPTLSAAAMGAVPATKAGVGSGVLNTARQVGGALGIAVLSAVATGRISAHWNEYVATLPAPLRAQAGPLAGLADGGQVTAIGRLAGPGAREAASSAFMSGFHAAMWTAAALCLLASAVALLGLQRAAPAPHPPRAPARRHRATARRIRGRARRSTHGAAWRSG